MGEGTLLSPISFIGGIGRPGVCRQHVAEKGEGRQDEGWLQVFTTADSKNTIFYRSAARNADSFMKRSRPTTMVRRVLMLGDVKLQPMDLGRARTKRWSRIFSRQQQPRMV